MGTPSAANLITDREELKTYFGSTPNLIGDVPIDVLSREANSNTYLTTDHPVEDGASMTDARIKNPEIARLTCIISDDLSDVSIGSIAQTVRNKIQTWREKLVRLYEIRDSNELIEVTTPLQTYTDMTITSINVEQTPETSQALFFTVELKKLRLVTAKLEQVSAASIPKRKKKKKTDDNDKMDDKTKKKQERGKRKKRSILAGFAGV